MNEKERLIRLLELIDQLDEVVNLKDYDKMENIISRIEHHLKGVSLSDEEMDLKKDFHIKYKKILERLILTKNQMKLDQNKLKKQMHQVMTGYFSKNAIRKSHYNHLG
ncbi:hypothetical protein EZV73_07645 [Acidaminobacter sp. JC074]|uniref:hypothetical protein n=1 Tax=Acidaminobacter sp. JC074 TaxID=2530199 RepID=UPI001F0E71A6|nr:hypothetical protein [Acidaminobacter sp. JC074]MCH4887439.1 hypothetical protein [Acidaminobacter sp. JC074]